MHEAIQTDTVHTGPVFSVEVMRFADAQGQSVRRDVVRHPGAVTIVPQLEDGRLVMVRNYRVAVGESLLEFPAGKIERDEPHDQTAQRELVEETGYDAGEMRHLGMFYTSPGFADERMQVYAASQLTHVGQRLEAGEMIEVEEYTVEQVDEMISQGRIIDGKTIAAYFLWIRFWIGERR